MNKRVVTLAAIVGAYLGPLLRANEESRGPGGFATLDEALAAAAFHRELEDKPAVVEALRRGVREQFVEYSAMTPWRSAASAFKARRGYSAQYNMALFHLLETAGIEARPVFAARVRDGFDRPWWRTAHVWVQVRIDGRVHDVCAGLADADGHVTFTPMTEVQDFGPRTRVNTAVVLTFIAAWFWCQQLAGKSCPRFMRRGFNEPA